MTVWLNVSFTAQWVGPVVGIARTERRIAEELNETLKESNYSSVYGEMTSLYRSIKTVIFIQEYSQRRIKKS